MKKKQKVIHEDIGDNAVKTTVVGVGLIRSPMWEYTLIFSHDKVEMDESKGKTRYEMQCKLGMKVVSTIGDYTTPILRHVKSKHKGVHTKVLTTKN